MSHQCQMGFSGGTLQDRKNQRHYSPLEGTKTSPPCVVSDTFPEGIINVQEMLMNNVLLRVIICEVFRSVFIQVTILP
jgi:hypothetical protein